MGTDSEITKNIVEKSYTDPVTGKFVKGNPGGGRPSGSANFKTKWEIFIDKVAKTNNLSPQEIDEQLFAIGYKKAKEGDFQFYKDIHDRIYGKAVQPNEHTGKGGGTIEIQQITGMQIIKEDADTIQE